MWIEVAHEAKLLNTSTFSTSKYVLFIALCKRFLLRRVISCAQNKHEVPVFILDTCSYIITYTFVVVEGELCIAIERA